MSFFSQFFVNRPAASTVKPGHTNYAPTVSAPETPSSVDYPPMDPGIPFKTINEILSAHQELLGRIKLTYGSDQPTFEKDLLSVIHRYAAYVHLLPAAYFTPS